MDELKNLTYSALTVAALYATIVAVSITSIETVLAVLNLTMIPLMGALVIALIALGATDPETLRELQNA